MIIVSFLYPNTEEARFDAAYYVENHVPMTLGLLGDAVRGVIVETGIGGAQPGAPAPYIAAFHALFESPDSFQKAFRAHATEIQGDGPSFTNIAPVVQIGNVSVATLMADTKKAAERQNTAPPRGTSGSEPPPAILNTIQSGDADVHLSH